jgi:hypothetical protein
MAGESGAKGRAVKGPQLQKPPPSAAPKTKATEQSVAKAALPAGVDLDLLPRGDDLLYEEELLRNPYALKM